MKVRLHPAAVTEFREIAQYYEERREGKGEEFIVEVSRIKSLLSDVQLGPRIDARHRRLPLRRFPFGIIYRVDASELLIIAIAHDRRRPGYWRQRS